MDAGVDLLVGDFFVLHELIADVVADSERIKERALLKDHASAGAEREELLLGQGIDLLAEEQDGARVGQQQSVDELEKDALADAGRPEQNAGFSGGDCEGDVGENGWAVKGDARVAQLDDRNALVERLGGGENAGNVHHPNMVSSTWVMRKSTKMMSTEEVTTA